MGGCRYRRLAGLSQHGLLIASAELLQKEQNMVLEKVKERAKAKAKVGARADAKAGGIDERLWVMNHSFAGVAHATLVQRSLSRSRMCVQLSCERRCVQN